MGRFISQVWTGGQVHQLDALKVGCNTSRRTWPLQQHVLVRWLLWHCSTPRAAVEVDVVQSRRQDVAHFLHVSHAQHT